MTKASRNLAPFFWTYRIESIKVGGNFIKDERVRVSRDCPILLLLERYVKRNGAQKRQVLLALMIVLFYLFFSSYLPYNKCLETDFPSAKPTFENIDQHNLVAYQQSKWSVLGKSTTFFILKPYLFRCFPHLSFEISCLDQKPLVLRC